MTSESMIQKMRDERSYKKRFAAYQDIFLFCKISERFTAWQNTCCINFTFKAHVASTSCLPNWIKALHRRTEWINFVMPLITCCRRTMLLKLYSDHYGTANIGIYSGHVIRWWWSWCSKILFWHSDATDDWRRLYSIREHCKNTTWPRYAKMMASAPKGQKNHQIEYWWKWINGREGFAPCSRPKIVSQLLITYFLCISPALTIKENTP